MALRFPGAWRFQPPTGGNLNTTNISTDAIDQAIDWIQRIATQGDLQDILEHFKGYFCAATGDVHFRSSDAGWAMTDLRGRMEAASENPPLFIEALYEACEAIQTDEFFAPDASMINEMCRRFEIGYELQPPNLRLRDANALIVEVTETPPTIAERSAELLQNSLQRAQELLDQGRGREAVQENSVAA